MNRISINHDLTHLNSFPAKKKQQIMHLIMERTPVKEQDCEGSHCYENAVTRLHAQGYVLIDLEPQEMSFTTVWYRESKSWLGLRTSASAAMLLWETSGERELVTSRTWNL